MNIALIVTIVLLGAGFVHAMHLASRDLTSLAQKILDAGERSSAADRAATAEMLTVIERIANPTYPDPLPVDTAPAFDVADVPWDHTDSDPYLHDGTFAAFVPKQQLADAPPIITHPMGIPGLEKPY